jgi:hypothetical protein
MFIIAMLTVGREGHLTALLPAPRPALSQPRANRQEHKNRRELMTQPPVLTGQDIAEAQGAVQGLLEHALAGTGTTSREYVVLRVLEVRGPFQSPASLHDFLAGQRQLALSPAAVAELLAGLQARGLATGMAKDGPGPAQMTPEGAALFRSVAETVAPATREAFAGIAHEDLAATHRVLRQVIEQAHRFQDDNSN